MNEQGFANLDSFKRLSLQEFELLTQVHGEMRKLEEQAYKRAKP